MNETLNRLLSQPDELPADAATLLHRLGWTPRRRAELDGLLADLEQQGVLVRIKGDRYVRPADAGMVTGRIRINRQGKGRLVPDQAEAGEVMIAEPDTGTALNEDRVLVVKDPSGSTGNVIRVLQRRRTRFVGTLHRGSGVLRVIPDDPRIPHEFYVPEPKGGGAGRAGPGDKVVVELRLWESRRANPEGEVVEILGKPDQQGVDMLSVLRQYALEGRFPDAVDAEARRVGNRVTERDLVGRLDCRGHAVVTIDPDDAKDFDDAICVEKESDGGWRLWVHVADVAHYVKPGSALDQEARERGNSTYLVDRVIPMLPEALSNELCSLKPGVDRLTQCVEFRLGSDGRVRKAQFHRAVIHSKRRYTYAEALEIIQDQPRDEFEDMIQEAHRLAQILRRARFNHGALELGSSEIKIRLDAQGKVSRLEKHSDDESHQLIEEFMLLANEAVATHLEGIGRTALHRVHEEPDPRRLAEYRLQVRALGIECGDLRRRTEMRKLTERIAKHPAGQALRIGLLRSLPRARYDVVPGGHFGLAKHHYTHFTSPIRRYADLIIHRALAEGAVGDEESLGQLGRHLSDTERNSSDAERDSREIKLFTYLEHQLHTRKPTVYRGIVSDVSPSGFFVDVADLSIGGMVPVSSLGDDFYVLDGARRRWVGRRTGRVFAVGDPIEIRVRKVDIASRRVDFELPGSVAAGSRGSSKRRGRAPAPTRPTPSARPGPAARPVTPARPATSGRPTASARPAAPSRPAAPARPAAPVRPAAAPRAVPSTAPARPTPTHRAAAKPASASSATRPPESRPMLRSSASARGTDPVPTGRPAAAKAPGRSPVSHSGSSRPIISTSSARNPERERPVVTPVRGSAPASRPAASPAPVSGNVRRDPAPRRSSGAPTQPPQPPARRNDRPQQGPRVPVESRPAPTQARPQDRAAQPSARRDAPARPPAVAPREASPRREAHREPPGRPAPRREEPRGQVSRRPEARPAMRQEPARRDEPRRETRPEVARRGEPRRDEPRREQARREEPRQELSRRPSAPIRPPAPAPRPALPASVQPRQDAGSRQRSGGSGSRQPNPFDGPPRPIPVPARPLTEPDSSDWSPGARGAAAPTRGDVRPAGRGGQGQRDPQRPRR